MLKRGWSLTHPKKNKPGAGPPKGSKNGLKFKEKAQRQKVFKELISHLENAWDQESFEPCDWETVMKYCADFPEDFPADRIAEAKRRGHKVIEGLLKSIAQGKIAGNAPTAIFLAKNKIKYTDNYRVDSKVTIKDDTGLRDEVFALLEENIRSTTANRLPDVHKVAAADGKDEPKTPTDNG